MLAGAPAAHAYGGPHGRNIADRRHGGDSSSPEVADITVRATPLSSVMSNANGVAHVHSTTVKTDETSTPSNSFCDAGHNSNADNPAGFGVELVMPIMILLKDVEEHEARLYIGSLPCILRVRVILSVTALQRDAQL